MFRSRHCSLLPVVLAFSIPLVIYSCKKDDVKLPMPQVSDTQHPDGKDSLYAGDTVVFRPSLTNAAASSFTWSVNGTPKGTDSTYSFSTDSAGDYAVSLTVNNAGGTATLQYQLHVYDKYANGIFLINEGWFGHDKSSVNFYRPGADTIRQQVYALENPGKELGYSADFAAVFNHKLYIISKQGPLVVTDARTMKETGRIETLPADARAFAAIDESHGVVSTADGLYPLDLSTLTVGSRITGIDGEVGSLMKQGDHLFAITQNDGLVVMNAADYSVVKSIAGMTQGLSTTRDGMIWTAGGDRLVNIDPATLDTASVWMGFSLADPWFAWVDGTVTASSAENAVYIARTGPYGGGGNEIYKYVVGDTNTLHTPFATLPDNQEFYGSSIRYDTKANQVVSTAVQSGFGDNFAVNHLYFFDAVSGALNKTVAYGYYYLPGLVVFNP